MPCFETASSVSNATTQSFQQWVSNVNNLIISCGFTEISASGILDTASTTPVQAAGRTGYRIYAFNDALQSTNPIFFRIDFGFFSSVATPSMWVSVGPSHVDGLISSHSFANSAQPPIGNGGYNTGSSGQTWFTGSASFVSIGGGAAGLNEHQWAESTNTQATQSMSVSGDGSWMVLALWWTGSLAASVNGIFFSIERTHDSGGNDDGRGCLVALANEAGTIKRIYTLMFNSASAGEYSACEQGLPTMFRTTTSSSYSSSVGLGHQIAVYSPQFIGSDGPEVSRNMIIMQFADTSSTGPIPQDIFVPIRGHIDVFRLYPPSVTNPANFIYGAPTNAQVRFGLRYEA